MNKEETKKNHTGKLLVPILGVFYLSVLFLLWKVRGNSYVGWELLGPAQGKYELNTIGLIECLRMFGFRMIFFFYWNHTSSYLFGFIPGLLEAYFPKGYWAQLINLFFLWVAYALLLRHKQFSKHIFLLLLLTSPAILAFSIIGYPYSSGILPFAAAITYVFSYADKDVTKKLILRDFLAFSFISVLSLNCYELGKTAFLVPMIAAVSFREIGIKRRMLWFFLGCLMITPLVFVKGVAHDELLGTVLKNFFILPIYLPKLLSMLYLEGALDLPIITTIFILLSRVRSPRYWFWLLLVLSQFFLILVGLSKESFFMMPRRFILIETLMLFSIAWKWNAISSEKVKAYASILIAGGLVWTGYTMFQYAKVETPTNLPYSAAYDFTLNTDLLIDTDAIIKLAQEEIPQFLWYAYEDYPENSTDPVALLERVYLALPHKQFMKNVFFVGENSCRYSCVPVYNPERVPFALSKLNEAAVVHIYKERKVDEIVKALEKTHQVAPREPELKSFKSFTIYRKHFLNAPPA